MKKVFSEITGSIWKVEVQPGASVEAGQTLLIVESRTLEIPIEPPSAGTAREVRVAEGEAVQDGEWLVTLD